MAMRRGRTLANCFFIWAVALGASALTSISNCALVMIVLQSPAALAAGGFCCESQTPVTVRTAASSATEAEVSAAVGWLLAGAGADCGPGALRAACPQAAVPNKTHTSQLIRITLILQD